MNPSLPAPFLDFIAIFNRGAFWESHEVLEAPWRKNRSGFYKGLILYASAYVHVQRGNARGVISQLQKAERHLVAYRPVYLGLDVDALLAHAIQCRGMLAERAGAAPGRRESLIPLIHLEPEPTRLRGDEMELRAP